MIDNILLEIYLPVTMESFDVRVRRDSTLYFVTKLVASALAELSEGYFLPAEDTVLCDRETGTIFNINLSVEELGLRTGSKLMII